MSEEVKTLVPKLRFPEFQWASKWVMQPLKCVAQLLDGDWIESKDQSAFGVRLIQTGNIGVGDFIPKDGNARFISEDTFRRLKCSEVVPGDCLISRLPDPAGRSCLVPDIGEKMITAVDCTIVRFDLERIVPYFFISFSQTDQYFSEVLAQASGSTRLRISRENLSNIDIPLTALTEQQKIADCLSSLDDLITAQNQKVEALKQHKKGLMQQLFPAEGETVPKLRFPEFENDGEWSPKILSTFIEERSTLANQDLPLYSLTIENGVTPKSERYERAFLVKDEADAYKVVEPNDFAFNPMNLRFGAIARHAGDQKVALSKYYNIFYCDSTVDSRFCEAYFKSEYMVSVYDDIATGSLIEKRRVHFSEFLKLNLRFPELKEQQKIADLLTSTDNLITAQTQQLEAYKTHKKGLMQQLFPSLEEIA